jgi:adenylosuccinate lyase
MIERYSLPEMTHIWSEQRKCEIWLEIEISVCEALAQQGQIPLKDATTIRKRAKFNLQRVKEIEKRTNHDVIAFIEEVASHLGHAGRWLHFGMTSSDLLDTTLAIQMVQSADILLKQIAEIQKISSALAKKYSHTPMIGRSHGIHAEPITFGLKMALLHDEFRRCENRIKSARENVRVGKISGAVGTFAHLEPAVEKYVCKKLGLKPDPISTQIIQRDRHAEFISALALTACTIDRWATEFRHLQRTEVLELEEYFAPGQKGSSAMPHKRNPITGERLSGLARLLRGYSVAAMENVALWHERDISHSSVERVIMPDACGYLSYMLHTFADLLSGLQIYPAAMSRNMWSTGGLFLSQSLLLELIRRGAPRKEAYEKVQSLSMRVWEKIRSGLTGKNLFLEEALADEQLLKTLGREKIRQLCSEQHHFRHVNTLLRRAGISPDGKQSKKIKTSPAPSA